MVLGERSDQHNATFDHVQRPALGSHQENIY